MSYLDKLRADDPRLNNVDDETLINALRKHPKYQRLNDREFAALVGAPEPEQRNSESVLGLVGDTIDAAQMGAYGVAEGVGRMAEEYTGFGETLQDFGESGSQRQLEQMSPRAAEAIQQQIFESTGPGLWDVGLGEGANPLTVFLQTAALAGEAVATGLGTGTAARMGASFAGKAVGKTAYKKAVQAGASTKDAQAAATKAAADFAQSRTAEGIKMTAFGVGEAVVNTGQIAGGARAEVMGMDDAMLDESQAFQDTYWDLADENPNASVDELRQRAKTTLADATASLVMRDPALLLSTAALGGYGGKVLDDLVTKGVKPPTVTKSGGTTTTTGEGPGRLGSAVRQAATQFVAESGQGAAGEYAVNKAIANSGADPERSRAQGVVAAGLSEGLLGAGMGAGFGAVAGTPRQKPKATPDATPDTAPADIPDTSEAVRRAQETAAAAGGDALDQTMAGQQAEQEVRANEPDPQPAAEVDLELDAAPGDSVEQPSGLSFLDSSDASRLPPSRVPVEQINVDPGTYQFRSNVNAEGVDDRLGGITEWDDLRADNLLLHQRNDGQIFAADGHHRIDLAKRLQQPDVNAIVLREEDGHSVEDVRRIAAESNISKGNATAIDAAKVFRNSESDPANVIQERNLPGRSQLVRDGVDLAKLADEPFGAVLNGVISEKDGAMIGRTFDDPEQQVAAVAVFRSVEPENDNQRAILANEVKQAGFADAQGEQGGLFGDDPAESLIAERVKIMDHLRKMLVGDKRFFATLNNNAQTAEQAGNVIAADSNQAQQDASSNAIGLLERATTTPEINGLINDAARNVRNGEPLAAETRKLKKALIDGTGPQADERDSATTPISGSPDAGGQEPGGDQPLFADGDDGANDSGEQRLDDDLAEPQAAPRVNLRKNGQPFASDKSVRMAKAFRDTPGAEPVEVDGGWGWTAPDPTPAANDPALDPDQQDTDGAPAANDTPDTEPAGESIIEHTTKKGKVLRGVVRKISSAEAKAIDPFTFPKDGGFFIREKHLAQGDTQATPDTTEPEAEPYFEQAKALMTEQRQADPSDKRAAASLKRKIRALAKKVPPSNGKTVLALDTAATRLDMGNLEFAEETTDVAPQPEPELIDDDSSLSDRTKANIAGKPPEEARIVAVRDFLDEWQENYSVPTEIGERVGDMRSRLENLLLVPRSVKTAGPEVKAEIESWLKDANIEDETANELRGLLKLFADVEGDSDPQVTAKESSARGFIGADVGDTVRFDGGHLGEISPGSEYEVVSFLEDGSVVLRRDGDARIPTILHSDKIQTGQAQGLTVTKLNAKPDFELGSQTEEERAQAEAEQRTAKEAEDRKRREQEQRAQADDERNNFDLTGSDRPADVAAAGGQGDLLGANSQPDTNKPKGNRLDNANVKISAKKKAAAEELAALIKSRKGTLGSGVDPEVMLAVAKVGALSVSEGAVKFAVWVRDVLATTRSVGLDDADVKPFLKEAYGAISSNPSKYDVTDDQADEMDAPKDIRRADVDSLASASEDDQSLSDYLFDQLDTISDNRDLKKAMAFRLDVAAKDVTPEQMKEAQEAIELALVRKARSIVDQGMGERETFDALVGLYKAQPNLNMRSSTSMENQAYSTPAPLAYLSAKLAGIDGDRTVYEPTAGNGMLLITADPENATVNEMNDVRAQQLREQGFQVTQKDATEFVPIRQADSVIMNPPFGTIKPVKYDGYTLKAIDHLITAKALEAMSDDGRATIIIGASKVAGGIKPADRTFFNWLYSHYTVTDHFEVDGDLYSRQGAGWPVRVITVNGRQSSKQISPKDGTIERVDTWDQVYERYIESLEAVGNDTSGASRPDGVDEGLEQDGSNESGGQGSGQGGVSNPTGGRSGGGRGSATGNSGGAGVGHSGGRPESNSDESDGDGSDKPTGQQGGAETGEGNPDGSQSPGGSNPDGMGGAGSKRPGQLSKADASDYQQPYRTFSGGTNSNVLTPANMADATAKALQTMEDEVGDLDDFVRDRLGYDSVDDMHEGLMGLQVDSIAAAIYNAERDKGIIIADQTGVGKGRQAAGIMRYAKRIGKIPIFITVKDNLFTDMYNDLKDIGSDFAPFILNQDGLIKDGDEKLFKNPARAKHKAAMQEIVNTGKLPDDRDSLFLTYSQLGKTNIQRDVLTALKDKAFFVMDESHNAAGEREKFEKGTKKITTAGFIYESIESAPVAYLSATYAKRPDNIPVYYRTALMDAVDQIEDLVDAVAAGGSPLQTVLSSMLARAGQLFRRERSFKGIEVKTKIDTDNTARHTKFADQTTIGLRAIVEADKAFHSGFVKGAQEQAKEEGRGAKGAGNKASKSVDHTNFTSIVHNFISQMLLGLKAERAAEQAIEAHKNGEKPVIALENTMGSFLKNYVEANGLSVGDKIKADYRDVLKFALKRTRRLSETDQKGEKETTQIELDDLDPDTKELYLEAERVIDSLELDALPISPIDYVRNELEQAGISVSEITGRGYMIDYSSGEPILAVRSNEEQNDRRGTVDKFNDGKLDALVLNAAGSTGLSIHSSKKFKTKDQKRHMIVMQAMADINVLMQMLGRINRTGQNVLPQYTMMGLDIPAEKRPLAKTANKMKSLNANTSANTESDTSVKAPDIMNKYGDRMVTAFLAENPDVARLVDMPVTYGADDAAKVETGEATKFTGRLALLPVEKQIAIYEEIETAYADLIDYLDKTNQNDLKPTTLDLDAKIKETKVVYEGKAPETVFGGHTYLHKVDTKYQGKPPTPEDVAQALDKAPDADKTLNKIRQEKQADTAFKENLDKQIDEAIAEARRIKSEEGEVSEKLERAGHKLDLLGESEQAYRKLVEQNQEMLDTFKIGNRVTLELDDELMTAVVVNVKDSHKPGKGNPYSLSKTRVSFMVNSGIRQIDLPFSRLKRGGDVFVEQLRGTGKDNLAGLFDKSGLMGDRREQRYIATGNLIAGSANLSRGRIVHFTDADGNVHQGIMMPRTFKGKDFEGADKSKAFSIRGPVVAKFLRDNRAALKPDTVKTQGAHIRLYPAPDGRWEIALPKANKIQDVKKVKFDKDLRAAMGADFYGHDKNMTARFPDARLESVLDRLGKLVTLTAPKDMRDQWTQAGGPKAAEPVKSFTPDEPGDTKTRYSRGLGGAVNRVAFDPEQVIRPITRKKASPNRKANEPVVSTPDTSVKAKAKQTLTDAIQAYPELGNVQVVESETDLPESLRAQLDADGVEAGSLKGAFHDGELFVLADNIDSTEDGVRAAVHEAVGHKGIHGVLGKAIEPAMLQLYRSLPNTPQGRKALAKVKRDYPHLDPGKREDRIVIAEEMVAHLLETGHRPKPWQRVVAKIRSLLRQLFPAVNWSYTDVLALGERSREWLQQENGRSDATRYSIGRAARAQKVSDHFDDLDDDQTEFVNKFGTKTKPQRVAEWWREKTDRLGLKFRQGLVDAQAALLELDRKALGSESALKENITRSSWVLSRMANAANGAVHAMMNNGRIYLDPDEKVIDLKDDDSKGLGAVLGQLGEAPEIERFMMWIAANRSEKLAAQGRENLFTDEEIAAGIRLNQGTMADGRTRNDVYEQTFAEFQAYRDDVLAIAEQAGMLKPALEEYEAWLVLASEYDVDKALVSRLKRAKKAYDRAESIDDQDDADERMRTVANEIIEQAAGDADGMEDVMQRLDDLQTSQRDMWANEFYVPFYRLREDDDKSTHPGLATNGLSRQQAYKRLKGGTQNINDLLQNTMMNFHHLIEASLKNQAAVQAIDNAESLAIAKRVPESNRNDKTSTFVMRDGSKVFYEINDPMVYAAVTAMASPGMNSAMMKTMRAFKRVFTNMTTTTPQFMVANLIRDSLQATATSDVTRNAFSNIVVGSKTLRDKRMEAKMLAAGASFNFGHLYQGSPDEMRAALTRSMRTAHLIRDPWDVAKVRSLWDKWNDVNNFAENINRAAIYREGMDQGKGKLYSAFEARDLIDFSVHGAWPAIRVLIDVVPFLNARLQGLDKIYRSGMKPGAKVLMSAFGGDDPNVTEKQAAARFWSVTGALTLATVALYLHNQDDEEYQKLEEWQKDTYWFFRAGDQAFFIPKPFEVGAMATLAERMTEQFVDDEATGSLFAERLQHMLSDTFAFNITPQMFQPVFNIYANKDDFTGRPIESMGMQRLSPELRQRASTTAPATAISRILGSTLGSIGDPDLNPFSLSPVQVDHLIQGYLGQIGAWGAGMADTAWRTGKGETNPAQKWYEYQPVRRFYKNLGDEDRYTKYGTVFYEGLNEAQRAYADYKELRELGRTAEADRMLESKRAMMALRKPLNRVQSDLGKINKRMDLVRRSNVSAELKRQRLDRLRAIKNRMQEVMAKKIQEAKAS